jgi:hypothetical protein
VTAPSIDPQRRQQLVGLKLRALVREHLGCEVDATPQPIGIGAALVHDDTAWVLVDREPERSLGPAVAWAVRAGAARISVLAEAATGTLARRAAAFARPIEVWHVDERLLLPAVAEPLTPEPAPSPSHEAFVGLIVEGGAEPLIEHGVVSGEVAGLEVCRVVDDLDRGVVRLEVGVGAHDREAFQMLHGDVPPLDALVGVVEAVARHRCSIDAGSMPTHPLGRLAAERWWRWHVGRHPAIVGADVVTPVSPPLPRRNVKDAVPCVADAEGGPAGRRRLVFSTGVDLDLVPFAVDARDAAGGRPVALVVPRRDRLPIQQLLVDQLAEPLVFVGV